MQLTETQFNIQDYKKTLTAEEKIYLKKVYKTNYKKSNTRKIFIGGIILLATLFSSFLTTLTLKLFFGLDKVFAFDMLFAVSFILTGIGLMFFLIFLSEEYRHVIKELKHKIYSEIDYEKFRTDFFQNIDPFNPSIENLTDDDIHKFFYYNARRYVYVRQVDEYTEQSQIFNITKNDEQGILNVKLVETVTRVTEE